VSRAKRIALAVFLAAAIVGIAALQETRGLTLPWWGWALAVWTVVSFVLGRQIGRWLNSVQLTGDQLYWLTYAERADHDRVGDDAHMAVTRPPAQVEVSEATRHPGGA